MTNAIQLLAHATVTDHSHTGLASFPIIAGIVAGLVHVIAGPDHIAAVAPLTVDKPRRAWLAGSLWGIGHCSGIWLLAVLALVAREALPIDALSAWSERVVGLVLIAVGLWGLRRLGRMRIRDCAHTHTAPSGNQHVHQHPHIAAAPEKTSSPRSHNHSLFGIGILHGMAGSAHLLGVLPTLAMPDRASAIAYLLAFGIGSIAGMGLVAEGLGRIARFATQRNRHITANSVMAVCSSIAIAVGVFWVVF